MRILGLLGGLTLLAALAWPSADAARPLELNGSARTAKVVVGLLGDTESARLARLDETSLRPLRPLGPRLGSVDAWAFSPDGGRLAVAARPRGAGIFRDTVRVVGLQTLRMARKQAPLNGMARALFWGRADRIIALVQGDSSWSALVSIDVATRRVIGTKVLEGDVSAIARTPSALVLLANPANAIGVPKLVVVDAAGTPRTVSLDRIRSGIAWPEDSTADRIGTERLAGLAVDPQAQRAYVIPADGPSAEVDLQTLVVSYHDLVAPHSTLSRLAAWLQPSAQAKGLNGVVWHARWLGDGLIALTGINESASEAGNSLTLTSSPAGLVIVDTRDWTRRMLDAGATEVTPAAGVLLATGGTWSSASEEAHGMGLAVYGADRSLRYRLWPGTSAWVEAVWAGRAYIQVTTSSTSAKTYVLDVASGAVVGARTSAVPQVLLTDGPDY